MASAAAPAAAGRAAAAASSDYPFAPDSGELPVNCVFNAVMAGLSSKKLRRIIERFASQGEGAHTHRARERRRFAAVNHLHQPRRGGPAVVNPTSHPLQTAHILGDSRLIGVLLEAGADPALCFGPRSNALALALTHDQIETLRALLRSGRHRVDEPLHYGVRSTAEGIKNKDAMCRAVHLAIVPPTYGVVFGAPEQPPPRVEALQALVMEFGADANARDQHGLAPLHWLAFAKPGSDAEAERALDVLLALGADLEARDDDGLTPLAYAAAVAPSAKLAAQLLARGASPDARDDAGRSPLMHACWGEHPRATVPLLLGASAPATRRAVADEDDNGESMSAVDYLLVDGQGKRIKTNEKWRRDAIAELVRSGAPVLPRHASRVLVHAARLAVQVGGRAAARAHKSPPLHATEELVGLAFDLQEMRDVDEGLRRREARLAELEREVAAMEDDEEEEEESSGGGSEMEEDEDESSSGEEDDDDEEEEEEEKDDESWKTCREEAEEEEEEGEEAGGGGGDGAEGGGGGGAR